jgi:hypothetical protein
MMMMMNDDINYIHDSLGALSCVGCLNCTELGEIHKFIFCTGRYTLVRNLVGIVTPAP